MGKKTTKVMRKDYNTVSKKWYNTNLIRLAIMIIGVLFVLYFVNGFVQKNSCMQITEKVSLPYYLSTKTVQNNFGSITTQYVNFELENDNYRFIIEKGNIFNSSEFLRFKRLNGEILNVTVLKSNCWQIQKIIFENYNITGIKQK